MLGADQIAILAPAMATNYDQIHEEHIRESDAIIHRAVETLVALYSDRTHFIFELLQNAEDAGAKCVLFHLLPDRLEFLHDGEAFTGKDVRGICDVAKGTKAESITVTIVIYKISSIKVKPAFFFIFMVLQYQF